MASCWGCWNRWNDFAGLLTRSLRWCWILLIVDKVTLETAGNLTVSHITRICPQARAGVKRRIRNGHTLLTYPLFAAAHAAGSISTDHIAALGRVTKTRNRDLLVSIEPKLLALAAQLPFQRFVEALTYLAQHADADGPEPVDPETGRLRHVTHSDGVVDVQLRLSPVDGASFLELVEREADRLFHAYTRDRDMTVGETDIPSRSELLCEALMNLTTQGAAAGTTRQAPVTDLTLVERSHPTRRNSVRSGWTSSLLTRCSPRSPVSASTRPY